MHLNYWMIFKVSTFSTVLFDFGFLCGLGDMDNYGCFGGLCGLVDLFDIGGLVDLLL